MEKLKQLYDWLDNRTGIKGHIREVLFEKVPGGSRWRYVWGSTLTFALMIQFITGIFLWMGYSPSGQTAWESVYYIDTHMTGGHFLRGLHHWTAQVMTVLLVLHLMQVVIDGAYKAPREVNFWFGVILLKLVLFLSLTGYLLPWDQKGFWATKVATDILGGTPIIGGWLKQVVLGGNEYGHHTLTRFFALHAGILPLSVLALTAGHIYLFRRHGIKPKEDKKKGKDEFFWPEQVLKDAVACLAVLATILVLHFSFGGAHLDAPADPSTNYPARPDWYFLFLFQFLKYFPGHWEVVGAIVLPGIAMTIVFLMPIIGRSEKGHKFNVRLLCGILGFAAILTYMAVDNDKNSPNFLTSKERAHNEAKLVKELAQSGIPPEGALLMLNNSGPKLYATHCASCHSYDGHDGMGNNDMFVAVNYTVPRILQRMANDANSTVKIILSANRINAVEDVELGAELIVPNSSKPLTVEVRPDDKTEKLPQLLAMIAEEKQITIEQFIEWNKKFGKNKIQYGDIVRAPMHWSAPDLKGFASREYLTKLLHPDGYMELFGNTAHAKKSKMHDFLVDEFDGIDEDPDLRKEVDQLIMALSAEAKLPSQAEADKSDQAQIEIGRELFFEDGFSCVDCHALGDWNEDDYSAPDLTGYGSREWMLGIVHDPAHERFYGKKNDRMPSFGKDEKLTRKQMETIVDWLRESK